MLLSNSTNQLQNCLQYSFLYNKFTHLQSLQTFNRMKQPIKNTNNNKKHNKNGNSARNQNKNNSKINKQHSKNPSNNINKHASSIPSHPNKKAINTVRNSNQQRNNNKVASKRPVSYIANQQSDEIQNDAFDAHQHINTSNHKQSSKYSQLLQQSGEGFKRQKNKYFLQNDKYKGKVQREDQQEQLDEQQLQMDQQGHSQQSNEQQQLDFEDEQEDDMDEQQQLLMEQDDSNNEQYQNQSQQEESQELQNQEIQHNNNNQIKKALSMLKEKRQSTSNLFKQQINSINKQDLTHLKNIQQSKSKTTSQQKQESIQLKKLLEIYDRLVEIRYGQQNQLQQIKMYPQVKFNEDTNQTIYPPLNHELFTSSRELENQIVENLSMCLQMYKKLGKKCGLMKGKKSAKQQADEQQNQQNQSIEQQQQQETDADLYFLIQTANRDNVDQDDNTSPQRLNVDKIYSYIKKSTESLNLQIEKQLIKWSQKTSFLTSTPTNSHSKSQLNSLLMQTPIGQAKKVLSNWQRMAHKCQQKRGKQPFKILFQAEQNIHQLADKEIYDDYDLFIELQKYYLQRLDNQNQDKQFLQSATMKYLKNKQLNQLQHQKKQKQIDRKASKNRKIRYNVHTKLLNFMPAREQNVIQTRDQIVRNIFNCNATANEDSMEGNVSKYRLAQPHDETDMIEVE